MSNSSLVSYTKISPNKSSPRNHVIDTITIHCTAGQCTVQSLGSIFATTARQASSNYGIGKDGKIGMYVEEKDRSWATSSASNDNRAITIEVSSTATHPYTVTDAAYNALIELVADICKRNGIKKLLWKGDKALIGQVDKQNMTVHRWFANKACPGDYLYNRHGAIADAVNKKLGVTTTTTVSESTKTTTSTSTFSPYKVKISISSLRIRSGPGTNYAAVGYAKTGTYTIVQESTGKGANKWGKLKSGGWVALNYCTKIS